MLGAALSMPSTRTAGNVEGLTTHHSVSSPQYCASYRGVRASPPPHPRLCMPQRPQGPKRQPPGPFGPCRGLAFRVMSRVDGIARATERESGGEVLSRDSHMVLPRPSRLTGASCPWATTPPPPWGFESSRVGVLGWMIRRWTYLVGCNEFWWPGCVQSRGLGKHDAAGRPCRSELREKRWGSFSRFIYVNIEVYFSTGNYVLLKGHEGPHVRLTKL